MTDEVLSLSYIRERFEQACAEDPENPTAPWMLVPGDYLKLMAIADAAEAVYDAFCVREFEGMDPTVSLDLLEVALDR